MQMLVFVPVFLKARMACRYWYHLQDKAETMVSKEGPL